jgi:hypothetical protein
MPIVPETHWAGYAHFCDRATSQAAALAAEELPIAEKQLEVLNLEGGNMSGEILTSGGEALLIFVPFFALLVLFVFRLDLLIFRPRSNSNRRLRPASGVDANGQTIDCDPNGRPSRGNQLS